MRAPTRRADDLIGVAVFAIVGAALVTFASPPSWLQAVVLLQLAIALPGYAVSAAIFPKGSLPAGDRAIQAFVFSIGAAALGCLTLQLALDLHRGAWTGLMLGVTLVAATVARLRRRSAPTRVERGRADRPHGAGPALAIALFALAVVGAGVAVKIAADGVADQDRRQSFASLWAAPAQTGGSLDGRLEVGVWNHGGPGTYRLELRRGDEDRGDIRFRLKSRQDWSHTLLRNRTAGEGPLLLTLYADGSKYRTIELDIGAGE